MNPLPITHLYRLHEDSPVAVIGGAPSVTEDIKHLPDDCVIVSANEHAFELGMKPSYLCFMNDPEKHPNIKRRLKEDCIKISPIKKHTDFILNTFYFNNGFTGSLACWLACYISDGPVIICGFDLYGSKNHYYDKSRVHPDFDVFERDKFSDSLLRKWRKPPAFLLPHKRAWLRSPERVYVASGKLTQIFKKWKNT